MRARPLLRLALGGLVAGLALLFGGIWAPPGSPLADLGWFEAHGVVLLAGFILPAAIFLHEASIERFLARPMRPDSTRQLAAGLLTGTVLLGLGHLFQPSSIFAVVSFLGTIVLLAVGVVHAVRVARRLPARGTSTVDLEKDPLSKGDDACWKHVAFAHRFLMLGLFLIVIAYTPGLAPAWQVRTGLAGMHVLLAGYMLLTIYGLGHLWVPRFSGVPAIAAGAIKGELHTSLLGITGLLLGFLTGIDAFLIALGPFLFLGFFTYMGVLGANIMRNKSRTARVTPEFVYVPWTFAGVFWLISGVLLGILMAAVPDALAPQAQSLRWIHVHVNLFGGFTMLWLGWNTRVLSRSRPPRFAGAMKASFYGLNAALVVAAAGHLAAGPASPWVRFAAVLAVVGVLLYLSAMAGFLRGTGRAPVA